MNTKMKKNTNLIIFISIITMMLVCGCTSFISINRHNNGSCQHLDYSTSTEVKTDSSQLTIQRLK